MRIRLPAFNGIAPRKSPLDLPDTWAQVAQHVRLWNEKLRPWRAPIKVADLLRVGAKQTIYRFGQDSATDAQYWFHWLTDVDVVRSPVAGNERTFFSGDGAPKVTDSVLALTGGGALPNAAYDLGVPSPATAPTVAVSGTPSSGEQPVTRFYVYTFVNAWGEEGSHSPVSLAVDATGSQTITLSGLEVPGGPQSYAAKYIYETNGSGASAAFYMVQEVAAGTTSVSFTAAVAAVPNPDGTRAVGSPLVTAGWTPPPADLVGLTMMNGTTLCGISGKAVRMAVPNYPYAWPERNEFRFEFDPVAIASFGNTLVVGTTGRPYLIQGFEPETMQQTLIEREYACASKRSMVSIGGGVAYASPDGMIVVDQSGAVNITDDFFDRDQWQALRPQSMHAYWWDNRLVVFYDNGTKHGGLIFPPGREPSELGFYSPGAYVDPIRDALYLIVGDEVHRFDGGAPLTFTWRSKIFSTPRALNFSCARIRASGAITVKFYADAVLRCTRAVTSNRPFRLPSGCLSDEWEIEFTGTGEVLSAEIAESMHELKGV